MQLLQRFRKEHPSCETICEWALVALIVCSVLWRGGKSVDVTWVLTGVAACIVLLSHTMRRSVGNKQVPVVLWCSAVGFFLLTTLSYLYSQTANYGFDEVLRTGALALLFLWTLRMASIQEVGESFVLRVVRVLSVCVLVACSIGMLVYVFQPVNRFVGTFFDYRFHTDYWPNAWAQFLLLTWPIVLYWVLRNYAVDHKTASGRLEFLVRALVMGIVISCLFLSYSRGALLVFVAQLCLWAGTVFLKTRSRFPLAPVIPVFVSVLLVAIVGFQSLNSARSRLYEVQEVAEKVTLQAAEGSSSVSERFQFWQQSFQLGMQKPLLGWGPYSFRFVQPSLQAGVLATSDHPHNIVLKLFMERGFPAAVLFVVVVGYIVWITLRLLLSDTVTVGTLQFSLRMMLFLGVTGVLLHNMIDFNIQFVGIAVPFWLCMGMLISFVDFREYHLVPASIARFAEMALAVVLLLAALYEGSYLVVSSMGRRAQARGDTEVALTWYQRSGGEFFTRDVYLSAAELYADNRQYADAQEALDAYFARNTQDYRAWKRQAALERAQGNMIEAEKAYSIAFARARLNDLSVLHGLIQTYEDSNKTEQIDDMKPEIDVLLKRFADAIQVNAHYIALSPNVEELIALANTMADLYPDEAPRYQVMAAKADHHAQIERERIVSRPPGFLW